jgi:lipoic acid synthetase
MPGSPGYIALKQLMRKHQLNSVCEEARCPNIGECWGLGTATFMILGNVCTRSCHYCAVTSGRPTGIDLQEPNRLVQTVKTLGLQYCVITSVNRDDLPDGGAYIFSSCIKKIHAEVKGCKVEVLIPDFDGSKTALKKVIHAQPDVLNHNIEAPIRIFPRVRPRGDFQLSLNVLAWAKEIDPSTITKSGIIVGMGETTEEVVETMQELRNVECDLLTIGQYLRPSPKHLPMDRFYAPQEFTELGKIGKAMGFKHVASGPLVRSSYHANEQHLAATSTASK